MIEYLEQGAGGVPGAGEYRAGVCNIGPAEIARRRRIGYFGLAAAVGLGAALLMLDAPTWTRLAVALPVAGAISGFLQARMRFCAGFGMSGLQNMGELGEQVRVQDAAARAADRRKALQIHGVSIAGGIMAGIAFALLPL